MLLNNLSLWRAMQVLPVTFMKQSESNKKHLRNMSLDLMFFVTFLISESPEASNSFLLLV